MGADGVLKTEEVGGEGGEKAAADSAEADGGQILLFFNLSISLTDFMAQIHYYLVG